MNNQLVSRVKIWVSTIKREATNKTSDFKERFSRNRNPLIPPLRLRNMVGGASVFMDMSEQFYKAFREVCDLKPNERVLDVGCGAGRIAFPLVPYLNEQGSYEGFDISKEAIDWCQKAYRKHPNFHFQVADIYNGQYNPTGKIQSIVYKFPYEDASFDFVFLVSVFTHMLPPEIEHYTAEIARVLKPKGRCLITYFLDPQVPNYEEFDVNFKFDRGEYRIMDEKMSESAIAYPESKIKDLYSRNKLTIIEPILYGKWAKRQNTKNFSLGQDAIFASKLP